MNKKWLLGLLTAAIMLVLAACGGGDKAEDKESSSGGSSEDDKTIVVGASNTPHAVILEQAKPILKEQGYDLQIETFQDYVLPNTALEEGDLDANYFQHIPYLELQEKEQGYDFANAGAIHLEPMAVYSKKYKSLKDLPKGATIILSNSVAEHGRVLMLLEKEGLIKIKDGIDKTQASLEDIAENPKDLQFDYDYEPALLPQIYNNEEGDAVVINSNYAIDAGISPTKDSVAIESTDSPYANLIVTRTGDENSEKIKALVEVLKSKEIQDFITKEWNGAVVPVTE
ncbi:MetQ/NlpA family ABC transporter substrate-binding protein [Domibacillus sp. DTU_2020_1001157_1_SI_ALB_TIR_016]|uniref:MetQ/NlpA family ABC transporter substrate-binding protein n=1 Tax=Domibacillus sp. DTU_2020_1001157_1_SI_ALB_TIR_016 TaxID=3077789 RepID=UPI0028ED24AF|nr:MetQ/NlpA family ABC transporter substrate-binding protein [Domibacillus sp. DTU_2020_1001157_1_SI_ALB_TIR_016]WNS81592.1 MetQ/NlpA family ABC transporter substrate-binding protein [Domibacillus sp. DTU_2020_1001157_1_SI_ALB_TIR_016]